MREGIRVWELEGDEGNRLLRIVRRSSGSVVRWRRAQMAKVAFTSPDRVREVLFRFWSKLLHLGVGRRYSGTRVMLLVAEKDVRVINDDGELLAEFTIDPTKTYQTQKRPGQRA